MKILSKLFIVLLIISFGIVNSPNLSIAQEDLPENTKVTVHKPEGLILTEKKPSKSKVWLWALIGVLAVVGGVAAVAGGSGGGGSDQTSSTGDHEFTW